MQDHVASPDFSQTSLEDNLFFTEKPILWRLNVKGLLALAGIIGPIVLLIADVTAARSAAGYHYILTRDSISILALMPMGWIQTIGFLTIGLFIELFAAGLSISIRRSKGFALSIFLLVCFGFGLLLIGAFHTDYPGDPTTVEGAIHGTAARTVFSLLPLAGLLIAPSLKKDPHWQPLFLCTIGIMSFALAWTLVWILIFRSWPSANQSWFGLYERILVGIEVLWVEIMAIWLLRLSLGKRKRVTATPSTQHKTD